uniref:Family with sequence similarity 13, member A n=1 Tax=Zonotrichia albicollis TaxID=44394 RepID=A0A8D2NH31_ZONAL
MGTVPDPLRSAKLSLVSTSAEEEHLGDLQSAKPQPQAPSAERASNGFPCAPSSSAGVCIFDLTCTGAASTQRCEQCHTDNDSQQEALSPGLASTTAEGHPADVRPAGCSQPAGIPALAVPALGATGALSVGQGPEMMPAPQSSRQFVQGSQAKTSSLTQIDDSALKPQGTDDQPALEVLNYSSPGDPVGVNQFCHTSQANLLQRGEKDREAEENGSAVCQSVLAAGQTEADLGKDSQTSLEAKGGTADMLQSHPPDKTEAVQSSEAPAQSGQGSPHPVHNLAPMPGIPSLTQLSKFRETGTMTAQPDSSPCSPSSSAQEAVSRTWRDAEVQAVATVESKSASTSPSIFAAFLKGNPPPEEKEELHIIYQGGMGLSQAALTDSLSSQQKSPCSPGITSESTVVAVTASAQTQPGIPPDVASPVSADNMKPVLSCSPAAVTSQGTSVGNAEMSSAARDVKNAAQLPKDAPVPPKPIPAEQLGVDSSNQTPSQSGSGAGEPSATCTDAVPGTQNNVQDVILHAGSSRSPLLSGKDSEAKQKEVLGSSEQKPVQSKGGSQGQASPNQSVVKPNEENLVVLDPKGGLSVGSQHAAVRAKVCPQDEKESRGHGDSGQSQVAGGQNLQAGLTPELSVSPASLAPPVAAPAAPQQQGLRARQSGHDLHTAVIPAASSQAVPNLGESKKHSTPAMEAKVQQSKSAVRLKEDMKKIAGSPLNKQRNTTCPKVFGVSLLELQQQGLSKNGIPIVVWNIVEYLTQHGMTQEGLFRVNGSMKMVEQLRLQYERGEEVELVKDGDVYSAASLLKLFLRELPDGIITSALHPRFIQLYQDSRNDMQKESYLKELLKELPDAHYSLLKYLCQFLIKVAEHHVENRMNLGNLATVFGPNFFHVRSGFEGMKELEICNKIMTKMLENYNTLFELEGLKKDEEKPVCEELAKIILVKITKPPTERSSQMCLLPQPGQSEGMPQVSLPLPDSGSCGKEMDLADETSFVNNDVFFFSSQEDERPMSPFYVREVVNKENIPSGFSSLEDCILATQDVEKLQDTSSGYLSERNKSKRQKSSTKLSELNDNQDSPVSVENFSSSKPIDRTGSDDMEILSEESKESENDEVFLRHSQLTSSMKIQEHPSMPENKLQRNQDADDQESSFVSEVPRLDLTSLCDDNNWEEPIPALSSWQRDGLDSDEARLSPQAGRLIRQLLDEDSDPMLSPRFYAYGQSQQYLDDTEVPPSPPNSHSFMRRRSSSLGSYEDDREDLTPAQLTRRIQGLKKKIRKFEDKFEEERKYRPSHSDKAANPEVLKWTNDLAKFRKQLKESKLKISEEDLGPVVRQRSNTLPKSFGSQLDKEDDKKQDLSDKSAKPAVEVTLESIQKKLQEKRAETNRPEDIKDMTRDQIAAEKVALQRALLNYEGIHGRPVTKNERQVMKPLYDRYRLVKQILSRANTIPIIEEEEGSEEDSNVKPDLTITIKTDFSVRSFLDQLEDDADGFVSPVDDKIPSRSSQDMGLSNLHEASIPELVEQLQEVREEKKRIRKKLRDFEDNFFRQNGRNVQKEDRTPMAEEYNEYKQVKAKLRLLEVLISKRDISSKIM